MHGQATIARAWWRALSELCYLPIPAHETRRLLSGLVGDLAAALERDPFDPTSAVRVGAMLVEARLTDPAVVAISAHVLGGLAENCARLDAERRWAMLLAYFGRGYGAALQQALGRGRRSIEQAMADARRAAEGRFQVVFDNAAIAIAVCDTEGRLIDANPGLAQMTGIPIEDLRGESVYDLAHPDDRDELRVAVGEKLVPAGEGTFKLTLRIQRGDRTCIWASVAITFVEDEGGQDDYLLVVGEDVTENHRMHDELHRQARHDPLTGLPNRRYLVEQLDAMIARTDHHHRIGVCFLDLDGFKDVNDRYGHRVGDRLLVAVAHRLSNGAREHHALLARIGGDEFVAAFPAIDTLEVIAVASTLRATLIKPIMLDQASLQISASIGAVGVRVIDADAEKLLDAADGALIRAKAEGKNRWVLYAPDTTPEPSPVDYEQKA